MAQPTKPIKESPDVISIERELEKSKRKSKKDKEQPQDMQQLRLF